MKTGNEKNLHQQPSPRPFNDALTLSGKWRLLYPLLLRLTPETFLLSGFFLFFPQHSAQISHSEQRNAEGYTRSPEFRPYL